MISDESLFRLGSGMIGLAFRAGGVYWKFLRHDRDLRGISGKLNRTIAMLILWADTDEKRDHVSNLLKGK